MDYKIIIDDYCTLTRIAIIENQSVKAIHLENKMNPSLQETIIQGRVEKVVKNLQGVFVDFGEDKNGLLHLKQIPPYYEGRIQQGKRLPVQIKRENIGEKGHKLTAKLNVKGDYLICMPFESVIVCSKKIRDEAKKAEIKELLIQSNPSNFGFMVRTKAEEVSVDILLAEMKTLIDTTNKVLQLEKAVVPGTVLWQEAPIWELIIKEYLQRYNQIECITNNEAIINRLKEMIQVNGNQEITYKEMSPGENLFQIYSLEKSFENILKHKIWLKNGGNIVIDYTEAMTVIDVNSAKAIEGKNKRHTIKELNQLAIEEAIGQIIKRNLSGIIIIDLVDFMHKDDREEAFRFARQLLNQYNDKRTKVYPLTDLDLLQISRTKENLSYPNMLLEQCRVCGQRSKKSTSLFLTFKIEQKLKNLCVNTEIKQIFLSVKRELAEYIKEKALINKFESQYGIKIVLKEDNKVEEWYDIKYYE